MRTSQPPQRLGRLHLHAHQHQVARRLRNVQDTHLQHSQSTGVLTKVILAISSSPQFSFEPETISLPLTLPFTNKFSRLMDYVPPCLYLFSCILPLFLQVSPYCRLTFFFCKMLHIMPSCYSLSYCALTSATMPFSFKAA